MINPVESQILFNTAHIHLVVINGARFTHLIRMSKQVKRVNSSDQVRETGPFTTPERLMCSLYYPMTYRSLIQ